MKIAREMLIEIVRSLILYMGLGISKCVKNLYWVDPNRQHLNEKPKTEGVYINRSKLVSIS